MKLKNKGVLVLMLLFYEVDMSAGKPKKGMGVMNHANTVGGLKNGIGSSKEPEIDWTFVEQKARNLAASKWVQLASQKGLPKEGHFLTAYYALLRNKTVHVE